ncbi:MAG: 50S ribosomal protein L9 [Chloroflexi bacterium]|nr:MAG: 50S ribosomal protein L9 [Chloroflexota bacterium]TMG37814.1 MAG: 50S ribosomal protein L9 [Chloroflexota bacterium]
MAGNRCGSGPAPGGRLGAGFRYEAVKIVLLEDVKGTGKAGESKDVADGYARNYLLPKKLAVAASRGAVQRVEREKATTVQREQKELKDARDLALRLEAAQVLIKIRVGKDGKLFGSVTNAEVASALKQQHGITLDRRKIEFPEPIRAMGPAASQVRLHKEVTARIPLMVTSA